MATTTGKNLTSGPSMNTFRHTTFAISLIAALAITFWPLLLYHDDMAPSHGQTSLLLAGLCIGVVYGSGILSQTPRNLQIVCAVLAWAALLAIGWLALPG